MRKFLAIALIAVIMAGFSGCSIGVGDVVSTTSEGELITADDLKQQQEAAASEAEKKEMTPDDVSDDLDGLAQYLTAHGAIAEGAAETNMESAFIGAKTGKKYVFSYEGNNNVSLELYEYDTEGLNETADSVISSVRETGKFTIMGIEVEAYLTKDDRYLMTYTDSANDDNEQTHANHKNEVIELFQNFVRSSAGNASSSENSTI